MPAPPATSSLPAPPRPTLVSIQCLRGIAALLVVLFHAHGAVSLKFPAHASVLNDFFFVISGFIMVFVSQDAFGKPRASFDFFVRRAIRISPLYWSMTALMVLLLRFRPQSFETLRWSLRHVVESFLFIPTTNSAGGYYPVLGAGWSLSYELLFYVVFALLLRTSLRLSVALTGALFGLTTLIGHVYPATGPVSAMVTDPLLLEFVLGECVALWLLRRGPLPLRACGALLVLASSIFLARVFFGRFGAGALLASGLPAAALVLALVSLERRERLRLPTWLARAGDESYSLYLSHGLVSAVLFKLCSAADITRWLPVDLLIPLAVVNAVVWGHLVYRFIERPMTQRLTEAWRRFLQRRATMC